MIDPACSDPEYLGHTLATLARVWEEIDAMERCGAVGKVLEEARGHARDLVEVLREGGVAVTRVEPEHTT